MIFSVGIKYSVYVTLRQQEHISIFRSKFGTKRLTHATGETGCAVLEIALIAAQSLVSRGRPCEEVIDQCQ